MESSESKDHQYELVDPEEEAPSDRYSVLDPLSVDGSNNEYQHLQRPLERGSQCIRSDEVLDGNEYSKLDAEDTTSVGGDPDYVVLEKE